MTILLALMMITTQETRKAQPIANLCLPFMHWIRNHIPMVCFVQTYGLLIPYYMLLKHSNMLPNSFGEKYN
jgi:hypothetical protein